MQFALFFRSPPSLCDTSPRRVAELFCPVWGEGFDDLLLKLKSLRDAKTNYRETPEEARKREQNRREYNLIMERQKTLTRGRGERTR